MYCWLLIFKFVMLLIKATLNCLHISNIQHKQPFLILDKFLKKLLRNLNSLGFGNFGLEYNTNCGLQIKTQTWVGSTNTIFVFSKNDFKIFLIFQSWNCNFLTLIICPTKFWFLSCSSERYNQFIEHI